MSHVINLSLIKGTIPYDLKSERAVPLFRMTEQKLGIYVLVSILTIIPMVFERAVHDRVESHLDQKKTS